LRLSTSIIRVLSRTSRYALPAALLAATSAGCRTAPPATNIASASPAVAALAGDGDWYAEAAPRGMTLDLRGDSDALLAKCVDCHRQSTPAEVARYHGSLHAQASEPITCLTCHGAEGHGEYVAVGYRFRAETLAADGKSPIGGGREHTYYEWHPKMVLRAMQSCQRSACHARNYKEHVGADRWARSPSAVTPFHGMLRFDHGISSWNDTMMSSFGIALWESYGTATFRENCIRCHNQVVAWNVAGPDPAHLSESDPFLRALIADQARDISTFAGNRFPGVERESLLLSRCVECHVRHEFSRTSPRHATACGKCHSGPDHPQIEAFDLSKHRLVVDQRGVWSAANPGGGPSCSTCHMSEEPDARGTSAGPAVNHDLTRGLAWNYKHDSAEWTRERGVMLQRCETCHSREYARVQLVSADVVARSTTDALMKEIQALCGEAYAEHAIRPAPNPFFDKAVPFAPTFFHAMPWQTGRYRVSSIELACWNAWRERGVVSMETGAWHFSPQFTQWLGIKPADEFIGRLRELVDGGRYGSH
jgi:hypothetical protein